MRKLEVGMRGRVYGEGLAMTPQCKNEYRKYFNGEIVTIHSEPEDDGSMSINYDTMKEPFIIHEKQFRPFKKKTEKSKRMIAWFAKSQNSSGEHYQSLYWFQEGVKPWENSAWSGEWREKKTWRRAKWLDEPKVKKDFIKFSPITLNALSMEDMKKNLREVFGK